MCNSTSLGILDKNQSIGLEDNTQSSCIFHFSFQISFSLVTKEMFG